MLKAEAIKWSKISGQRVILLSDLRLEMTSDGYLLQID